MTTEARSPSADEVVRDDVTEGLADDGQADVSDFDNTEADDEGTGEDGDEVDATEPSSPEDADLHEIEVDGEKHRVPATLRDAFMRTRDYYEKTQSLAEARKTWDTQRSQQAESFEALRTDHVQVGLLQQQADVYDRVDWDAYFAKDPDAARRDFDRSRLVSDQLAKARTSLSEKEATRLQEQQAVEAQALKETGETLAKDIKGWGPELGTKVAEYAISFGITPAELRGLGAPGWKIIHAAYTGAQAQQQQQRTQQVAKTQATQPVKTVSAQRTPARGLSDDLDDAAWLERRNAQLRAKAGR
jgi:hypothetical protein